MFPEDGAVVEGLDVRDKPTGKSQRFPTETVKNQVRRPVVAVFISVA